MDIRARSRPAVVVVGSVNVDLALRVCSLPRPGETVTGAGISRSGGGKGANQAVAAARLGARVWLIAELGDDAFGEEALLELSGEGVDISLTETGHEPTGVALILVDDGGENVIAVAPGANLELSPERVEAAIRTLPVAEAVILACHEIPDATVLAAAEAASSRGFQMLVNAAPARPLSTRLLSTSPVVICNQVELTVVASDGVGLLLLQGPPAVLVTMGSEGVDIHQVGRSSLHIPAPKVDVKDSIGAGDAFCGAFATRLAEGASLEAATSFAVRAAALSVGSPGARAGLPRRSEVRDGAA